MLARETQPLCEVRDLARLSYAGGLELQQQLVQDRSKNRIPDQLLLVEHPNVLTLGRNSNTGNILADNRKLQEMKVEVFEAGRGGDVTYHGPGQLVAYPILDLRPDRCDLHRYVRDLETVLIRLLNDYDLEAYTVAGRTGVWIKHPDKGEAKIAAIGVRVSRWISSHGIALNVNPDLKYYNLIVPCGIRDREVTSLQELLCAVPSLEDVAGRFVQHFAEVFERRMTARIEEC